jgi:hypothetical protein
MLIDVRGWASVNERRGVQTGEIQAGKGGISVRREWVKLTFANPFRISHSDKTYNHSRLEAGHADTAGHGLTIRHMMAPGTAAWSVLVLHDGVSVKVPRKRLVMLMAAVTGCPETTPADWRRWTQTGGCRRGLITSQWVRDQAGPSFL